MLELHQFAPHWDLPNASPFCMKVEAYLRLAGIEYKSVTVVNPANGPYGKAPWIVDDDRTIPDSRFIIEYLNRKHGYPLRNGLDKVEFAQHHALARMLDESTYWVLLHDRWAKPVNSSKTREELFTAVPTPLRKVMFAIAKRGIVKALNGHGLGRLSDEEIVALGKNDIDALSTILGTRPYFGGEKPAEIDASTLAYIANLIKVPIQSEVSNYTRTQDNLVAYYERLMNEVFPEYA